MLHVFGANSHMGLHVMMPQRLWTQGCRVKVLMFHLAKKAFVQGDKRFCHSGTPCPSHFCSVTAKQHFEHMRGASTRPPSPARDVVERGLGPTSIYEAAPPPPGHP